MPAHQQFRQLAVALANSLDDLLMFLEGLRDALADHAELAAVQPDELIEIMAVEIDEARILAAFEYAEVEIHVALFLEIALFIVLLDLHPVLCQQRLQPGSIIQTEPEIRYKPVCNDLPMYQNIC